MAKFGEIDAAIGGGASAEVLSRLERLELKHRAATKAASERLTAVVDNVDGSLVRLATCEDHLN